MDDHDDGLRPRELDARPPGPEATTEDWYRRALAYSKIEYRGKAWDALQNALALDPDHGPSLKLLNLLDRKGLEAVL